MNCPECGRKQHCPCKSCKPRHKQKVTWIWVAVDGPISCGHCGHTMGVDEWDDLEYQQVKGFIKAQQLSDEELKSLWDSYDGATTDNPDISGEDIHRALNIRGLGDYCSV